MFFVNHKSSPQSGQRDRRRSRSPSTPRPDSTQAHASLDKLIHDIKATKDLKDFARDQFALDLESDQATDSVITDYERYCNESSNGVNYCHPDPQLPQQTQTLETIRSYFDPEDTYPSGLKDTPPLTENDSDNTSECDTLVSYNTSPAFQISCIWCDPDLCFGCTLDDSPHGVPKQYDRLPTRRELGLSDHLLKTPVVPNEVYKGPAFNSGDIGSRYNVTHKRHWKTRVEFLRATEMVRAVPNAKAAQKSSQLRPLKRSTHDQFELLVEKAEAAEATRRRNDNQSERRRKRRKPSGEPIHFLEKRHIAKFVQRRVRKLPRAPPPPDPRLLTVTQFLREDSSNTDEPQDPRAEYIACLSVRHNMAHGISDLRPGQSIIVGYTYPPIGPQTLKRIQIDDFIHDPQARHDLIANRLEVLTHDREVGSSLLAEHQLTTATVGIAQRPMAHVIPRRVMLGQTEKAAKAYWVELDLEIRTGCRCARLVPVPDQPHQLRVYELEPSAGHAEICVCGRWLPTLSQKEWQKICDSGPYPSRIKRLLEAVRSLIKIMLPLDSVQPVIQHQIRGEPPTTLPANSLKRKTVEELLQKLDVERVTAEIRNGNFDYTMFFGFASAMKVYCAPIRDVSIDASAAYATTHEDAHGIRQFVEMMRQMRIDAMNRRLDFTRDFLHKTAPYHELPEFERLLSDKHTLLEDSDTQLWIQAASHRVLAEYRNDQRTKNHLMGDCSCHSRNELVARSIIEGIFMLLVANWTGNDSCDWKAQVLPYTDSGPISTLPESLTMDVNRIWHFSRELRKLTVEATILWAIETAAKQHDSDYIAPQIRLIQMACQKILDAARKADPDYLGHLSNPNGEPAAFITSITKIILFYNGLPLSSTEVGPKTPEETALLFTASLQLMHTFIASTDPESERYQSAVVNIRHLVTRYLTGIYVQGGQGGEFAQFFPAPHSDCRFAMVQLLSEQDVRTEDAAAEAFRKRDGPPIDPYRHISELHLLRWKATMASIHAREQSDLAGLYRLKSLAGQITSFAQSIVPVFSVHFEVYRRIYLSKGMLHGTGVCSPFEKHRSRAKRREWNARNFPRTDQAYVDPPAPGIDPNHMFRPT